MNAPDLADVLAEVNRLRAERGMDPLAEMPKGEPVEVCKCPVGRAIEGVASYTILSPGTMLDDWQRATAIDTPPVVQEFMRAFDRGAYPDLVLIEERA